jgi:acyl-CoA synthetase (NDP forming)
MSGTARDLTPLFAPNCIAIYGASQEAGTMGHRVLDYLTQAGFAGRILPVNPRHGGETIGGRLWHASGASFDGPVDHAVLAVRAQLAPAVVEDVLRHGVRSLSILAGGFAEIGGEGVALQARIAAMAREAGVPILGPNGLGFATPARGAIASGGSIFMTVMPRGGPLAIISQSGLVASDILYRAESAGIGAGFWVSTGNEADVTAADCIDHACSVPELRAIALYVEGIRDVDRFKAALGRARDSGRQVVVLRPGRTDAGRTAIRSHTGSMVSADGLYDALFRSLGAVRVDSLREMTDVARVALQLRRWPGRGVALAGSSGGNGALAVDAAAASGVPLAVISEAGQAKLTALVPNCSPRNPIDTTGAANERPEMLADFLGAVLEEQEVGTLVMIHGSGMLWHDRAERIAAVLAALAERHGEGRIAFCGHVPPHVMPVLDAARIPVFDDPVALVRAIGRLWGMPPAPSAKPALGGGEVAGRMLDEDAALDLLDAQGGVPAVARRVVRNIAALPAAAEALGYPLALKAVLPGVAHKTELGALRIDIRDRGALLAAGEDLAALCQEHGHPVKLLVEAMVGDAVAELLLSAFVDPQLGPFVAVGAGGTLTELLADVVVEPAPVSPEVAEAMLVRLRGWPRLRQDRRGRVGSTGEAVAAIVALSRLIGQPHAERRIVEVEVNPFMLRPAGSCAVDAVISIAP